MSMKFKDKRRTFWDSLINCFEGINYTLNNEPNFLRQIIMGIIVIICSFIFKISMLEWIVVLLLINFVLVMELINTAIEKVVDLYTLEKHPLAKIVKDVSSGAVLVMSFFAGVIGLLIFLPKIL